MYSCICYIILCKLLTYLINVIITNPKIGPNTCPNTSPKDMVVITNEISRIRKLIQHLHVFCNYKHLINMKFVA